MEQVQAALPGLLGDLTASDVAAVLLKHVGAPERGKLLDGSQLALLTAGSLLVADESELSVALGPDGVRVNGEANVVLGDVLTRNALIHFIDTVIVDDLL